MERVWTGEQLSAIDTRDKTLLVSAAAGSGKTATLTERIIRSLTDSENPESIDSLLVVTFTVSAAAELRAKISKALSEAIEKNPDNKHLNRQLYLLPSAKIRTIDSFCNEILRQNCDRVGISPNYRIADGAECEILSTSIIDALIEGVYRGEIPEIATPEEFETLADCLTSSKSTEKLGEMFKYIYSKCETAEDGIDALLPLIENLSEDTPVEKNLFGRYLIDLAGNTFLHHLEVMRKFHTLLASGDEAEFRCAVTAEADIDVLESLCALKDYDRIRNALHNLKLQNKASVGKEEETTLTREYAYVRGEFSDDLKDLAGRFNYKADMWRELQISMKKLLLVLYKFLKKFDVIYVDEKRRRAALSYADIERFTYNCLIKDGEPTDIAKNMSRKYSAIYIDEYQDVNSLQNRIFEVMARKNNRFMVGDIKQSIYCFRSARPEIFAQMKSSFPSIESASGDEATVFMSSNFRCDKAIVDFINSIFDRAFALVGESIGYTEGDRLGFAKKESAPEYIRPEICMLDKGDEEFSEEEVVARKIKSLLDDERLNSGNVVRPSDIAIIMRNAKDRAEVYVKALARYGIPSQISGEKSFFLSSEILLALCLLNSIDNPRRDIYLAGLMCSPLFSFTADELVMIRNVSRCDTLYESLLKYTQANPEFLKGRGFLEKLDAYRTISEGIGVDRLLYRLYRDTGLMALASKNGGDENLTVLYDYARKFEAGGFKGLYSFINFVNGLIDKKTTFDDARAGEVLDAVKIVTCHASKGLEYPIVFLVDASARIENKDAAKRLAFSDGFGMAMRLRTPSGLALVENPIRDTVNHRAFRKLYEEELRILYVALTRARERLFVIGTATKNDREKYLLELGVKRKTLDAHSIYSLSSFLEIILASSEDYLPKTVGEFLGCDEALEEQEDSDTVAEREECDLVDAEMSKVLAERFSYEYPDRYMTELPEKMSVSRISPTVLDGTDAECSIPEKKEERTRGILPSFAKGTKLDESAKRGIATHLFLQFCDIDALTANGASFELSRLVKESFISEADAERVRIDEIELFRESSLFREMKDASEIYRELRFNVRLPASEFTTEEERRGAYRDKEILTQGVIDCIVVRTDGTLAVYDYKTDRLPKEALTDRELAREILREKHKTQLEIYALAAERIFGKKVSRLEVYSLPLGDTVSMF